MTATSEVDTPSSANTIRNPATGAVAGQVRWTDPADVPRIAAGLREAQREWEARGAKGRAKVLARYAVWLGEHRDEIESLLIKETGKSAADAAQEVPLLIMIAVVLHQDDGEGARAGDAAGVAAVPGDQEGHRALPAAPGGRHHRAVELPGRQRADGRHRRAGRRLLGAAQAVRAHPADGRGAAARLAWIRARPRCWRWPRAPARCPRRSIDNADFIQFTGSSATGAKVMERAARRLTPVSLELGGKDPMIVLEDADVDLAAHAAVWGAMFNAGQTCVSVERVYVLESVYDQFVDAVVRDVKKLKVGAGEGYDFGSLIDDEPDCGDRSPRPRGGCGGRQGAHRRRAYAGAGQLLPADGARRRRPLDGVHDRGDLRPDAADHEGVVGRRGCPARQRQPVRPVAHRCSPRISSARKTVAVQLDCGAVNVNDVISNLMCTTAPMGGWKTSGMGARFGGAEGLRKFCRQEAVVAPRTNVGAGGNYYNNSHKALKRMNKLMTKLALLRPRRTAK